MIAPPVNGFVGKVASTLNSPTTDPTPLSYRDADHTSPTYDKLPQKPHLSYKILSHKI